MLTKMKSTISNNGFFVFVISIISLFFFLYLCNSSANIPIIDYWVYLNGLVEKSYKGGVSFSDLYGNNGIHRSPLQLLLFLANVHFFSWNAQIGVFCGLTLKIINTCLLYKVLVNLLKEKNAYSFYICTVLICVVYFTLGAYEILLLEFSTSAEIRYGSFLFLFYKLSNILCSKTISKEINWIYEICLIFTICFIGSAYSFAFGIAIILCLGTHYFITKEDLKNNFLIYASTILAIVFGFCFYLHGLDLHSTMPVSIENLGLFSLLVRYVKGCFVVFGSSLIGGEGFSSKITTFVGLFIGLIHLVCFILYFKNKLFIKSYLPLLLWIYTLLFIGELIIGRSGHGIGELQASRYIGDSIFAIIADIYVVALVYSSNNGKTLKFFSYGFFASILLGVFITDVRQFKIGGNRKAWCSDLATKMISIESYDDSDLGGFLANNPMLVRNGVSIMRKYKLGIFSKGDVYDRPNEGVYSDKWIKTNSKFYLKPSLKSNCATFNFYNNTKNVDNKKLKVFVNGEYYNSFIIQEGGWSIQVPLVSNIENIINLQTDFIQNFINGDSREVSLFLDGIIYRFIDN